MADQKQNNQSHEAKQLLLEKRFAVDLAAVEDEINSWTDLQHQKITTAQEKQVKELRRLVEVKASIEQEMATITEGLQATCIRSTSILQVALDGRVDDYDEALKQLEGLAHGKLGSQVEMSQEL